MKKREYVLRSWKVVLLVLGILLVVFFPKGIFAEEVNDSIDVNNSDISLDESISQYNLLGDGYYKIVNSTNKTVLESNGYMENLEVSFNEMNENSSQMIALEKQSDDSYVITFYNNKLVVASAENNKLVQEKFNNSDKQKWFLYQNQEGNILLKNKYTDNFIDIQWNQKTINEQSNSTLNISPILNLTSEPYVAEVPNGLYKIQSVLSGKNLEIYAGLLSTDAILSQWSNNGYNNQIFEIKNTETGSYVIASESKKPLGTPSYLDGAKIVQQESMSNLSQQYKIIKSAKTSGAFTIVSHGGTAFDVQYPSNGSPIVLRNINKTTYQDFKFISTGLEKPYPRKEEIKPYTGLADGYYSISSDANSLALEATDYNDGLLIKQNPKADKTSQTTYFEKQNDGSYVIIFLSSKKSLDFGNNNLNQWRLHKLDNQKWFLYQDVEGKILLKSKKDGSFIEVKNNVANDNLLMNINLGEFNPNKKFNINPVESLPTEPYIADVPNGLYKIQSVLSGKNLEIYAGSLDNGGLLSQWSNNGYNNQVFEVQNTNGGSYIISTESKKALDIGSYADGTRIIQVDKRESTAQRFKLSKSKNSNGAFNIVSNGGTVFDVQYPSNGSQIVLRNVNNTTYQDFNFIATGIEKPYPRKVTSEVLNVPAIGQLPELPTGCEITAITMMLQHSGANVDKVSMAWKMPYHGWDPNVGYVGSPFYSTGWTIYPPALTGLVAQYTGSVYNMTGRSITDIENQIINDKAVVVWVSDFYGFTVHAITITGFGENVLYYNDPWTGGKNNSIYKSYFNQVWSKQSTRAISY